MAQRKKGDRHRDKRARGVDGDVEGLTAAAGDEELVEFVQARVEKRERDGDCRLRKQSVGRA